MVTGRYLTVGLTCAVLHNAIVIAGDRVGLHYAVSSLISFASWSSSVTACTARGRFLARFKAGCRSHAIRSWRAPTIR
jgi:hypothetical protein